MRVDMHVHTWYSKDGTASPGAIVKEMALKGIDVIAVTDHDTSGGWEDFPRDKVIRGAEFSTDRGHVLGYFLNEHFIGRKGITFYEALDFIKDNDGILVIPHPFDYNRSFSGLNELVNEIDGIEVCNGLAKTDSSNEKAFDFAKSNKKMMTAGSDAHVLDQVGRAFLESSASSIDDFRRDLERGNVKVVCNRAPFLRIVEYSLLTKVQSITNAFGRPRRRY